MTIDTREYELMAEKIEEATMALGYITEFFKIGKNNVDESDMLMFQDVYKKLKEVPSWQTPIRP